MTTPHTSPRDAVADWARAYWRGQLPLWGQIWVWGMCVGTLVGTLMTLLTPPLFAQMQLSWLMGNTALALLQAYLLLLLFGFWSTFYTWHTVSVWRCAKREKPWLRRLARAWVLLVTFTFWPLYAAVILTNSGL